VKEEQAVPIHTPRITRLAVLFAALMAAGCSISTGPEPVELAPFGKKPILRLGKVTERVVGMPTAHIPASYYFKTAVLRALRSSEASSLFSSDPSSMTLQVDMVWRMAPTRGGEMVTAFFAGLTLGLIPIRITEEWIFECNVSVRIAEHAEVARYPVKVTGRRRQWMYPPSIFTMFGALARQDSTMKDVQEKVANNLVAKTMQVIATDYNALAGKKAALDAVFSQKTLRARAADATYYVRYDIRYAKARGGANVPTTLEYILKVYRGGAERAPLVQTLSVGRGTGLPGAGAQWRWRDPKSVVFYAEGRLWHPEWKVTGPYDKLASVELKERRATVKEALDPDSFPGVRASEWNNFLISWKNRELDTVLRESDTAGLRDAISQIEQQILKANEAAEAEKDKAQRLIQKGATGAEVHTQTARTHLSRIVILKPVLRAIKEEITNRSR
jgi:hypothetical protein